MSKKGKKKRTIDGHTFDSDLEYRYYVEVVKTGIENKTIEKCDLQVKYLLQPKFEKIWEKIQRNELCGRFCNIFYKW